MFVFGTCESQNFQSFMLHVIDAHLWKLTYMNNQGMLQPKSVFLYFMRMVLSVCLLQKWFHAFTSINCAFNRQKIPECYCLLEITIYNKTVHCTRFISGWKVSLENKSLPKIEPMYTCRCEFSFQRLRELIKNWLWRAHE